MDLEQFVKFATGAAVLLSALAAFIKAIKKGKRTSLLKEQKYQSSAKVRSSATLPQRDSNSSKSKKSGWFWPCLYFGGSAAAFIFYMFTETSPYWPKGAVQSYHLASQ